MRPREGKKHKELVGVLDFFLFDFFVGAVVDSGVGIEMDFFFSGIEYL